MNYEVEVDSSDIRPKSNKDLALKILMEKESLVFGIKVQRMIM